MLVGVPREIVPGERRVACVPELLPKLLKAGLEVYIQDGAGTAAGFPDQAYRDKGGSIEPNVLKRADIVLKVQPPSSEEIAVLREGAVLISFLQPYSNKQEIELLARRRVTAFSMELMPRISRAQSMDALSAMSTIAGYKAVLLAAARLHKFFPLLMTAAGTVTPAKVLVIGAGVAGLQAIGTARRLGAVVASYDTRPPVKEQVESLGGKFIDLGLETAGAEDAAGYARVQTDEFYRRQREALKPHLAAADVVITTALVPGQPAPRLITEDMVHVMQPGSVIVDLAAEQGGNCSLTVPGQETVVHGVVIIGPLNLPSTLPYHASLMYSRTVCSYLLHLLKDGKVHLDLSDELTRGPLVTHQGEIIHEVARATVARMSESVPLSTGERG